MFLFMVAAATLDASTTMSPPATGAVTLHIEAVGEVPPDMATVTSVVSRSAPDKTGLESAFAREQAAITARLKAAGVAEADIVVSQPLIHAAAVPDVGIVESVPPPIILARPPNALHSLPPGQPHAAPAPAIDGEMKVTVTVRNLQKLSLVYDALDVAPGLRGRQGTRYRASDPEAAHRLAVDRAFANARREAESYAAAVHLKLGPIERVSNIRPQFNFMDALKTFSGAEATGFAGLGAMAGESAGVAVDYVLTR